MACRSGSVEKVADKTMAAKEQIDKLETMLMKADDANKGEMYTRIAEHLSDGGVTDARELDYNSAIKVEYTSEFSLDRIAGVVAAALKALAKSISPAVQFPAMTPDAIDAYRDVVNTVAEAAKSSSTAAGSLSFSMNRLSPGLFAFLLAKSLTIKDEQTFGTEAVTATAIYYRFMESIDDVQNEARYGAALLDARNFLQMKTLLAALTDDLASGKISIEEWTAKDAKYEEAAEKLEQRLAARHLKPGLLVAAAEKGPSPAADRQIVRAAIDRLASMGDAYTVAIARSRERLGSGYY